MTISFRCPDCQTTISVEPAAGDREATCPECQCQVPFTPTESLSETNIVDDCPRCGKSAFYVQRDFNQKIGLGVMLLLALVGLVFVYYRRPMLFYACLGVGALFDLVLYSLLPNVTICYACKSTFRDVTVNSEHKPFDLHIADVYDNRSKG